jgi:hypothetical protein
MGDGKPVLARAGNDDAHRERPELTKTPINRFDDGFQPAGRGWIMPIIPRRGLTLKRNHALFASLGTMKSFLRILY